MVCDQSSVSSCVNYQALVSPVKTKIRNIPQEEGQTQYEMENFSPQEQQFGGPWMGSGVTAEGTLLGGRKMDPECIAALPQDAMWMLHMWTLKDGSSRE